MGDDAKLFDQKFFSCPECPEKKKIKKAIMKQGGSLVNLAKKGELKYNPIHLAPKDFDLNQLDSRIDKDALVSFRFIWKCVEDNHFYNPNDFLWAHDVDEEEEDDENVPMTPRSKMQKLDHHDNESQSGKPGNRGGSQMKHWTQNEIGAMVAFARNNTSYGLTGDKLWDLAARENICPGRTAAAMRECAKRRLMPQKDEIIGETPQGDLGPKKLNLEDVEMVPSHVVENLEPMSVFSSGDVPEMVQQLYAQTHAPLENVFWALYQSNCDYNTAEAILKVNDEHGREKLGFVPWSVAEDETIKKFAFGIYLASKEANHSARRETIIKRHADEHGDDRLDELLDKRHFTDILARAFFLCKENTLRHRS